MVFITHIICKLKNEAKKRFGQCLKMVKNNFVNGPRCATILARLKTGRKERYYVLRTKRQNNRSNRC